MNSSLTKVVAVVTILLFSCKENHSATDPTTPAETRSTMEYNQNQFDSIPETTISSDFKGGGGEPFWSVEIHDKILHFQSPEDGFKSIKTKINTVNVSGETIAFQSKNGNESIKVVLLKEECIDGMSGFKNSHKVTLSISFDSQKESKIYEGCGSFDLNG